MTEDDVEDLADFHEIEQKNTKKNRFVDLVDESYKESKIDESDRLSFAKRILWYLFVLVIFVFAMSYISLIFYKDNKELIKLVDSILDITKTAVPSIVTLVLGFYFGKKDG